ncbi:hypothetical protein ACVBEF_08065 [Glaciimonas sp. GG7]
MNTISKKTISIIRACSNDLFLVARKTLSIESINNFDMLNITSSITLVVEK